ncbi:3393_t:CDS:1, partial [Paraglomus occultum]
MQKLGFGLTRSGVNHCVMEIMRLNKRPHPFGENGPGQDWWARFMRDHPELSFRITQELSEARAQKANATVVKDRFEKLHQIIHEFSLTAAQIWNMDETGFVIIPKLEKVVARKGARQVHKIAHGNSHEHISVVPTISAAGSYIPPLIIYKGVRTIPGLLESAPPGTVMGFTNTGYMREELFRMYLRHFINSIPPSRPVLLMLDGHKSHISYTIVDYCRNNGILLYALPPHTTHVLQPSEILFAKLKKEYGKACEKYSNDNNGMIVTKRTFAKVFGPAFIKTYTPLAICNAYKATGIWPLNPNAISPERLDPSLMTEQINTLSSSIQPSKLSPSTSQLLTDLNHTHIDSHSTRLNKLRDENRKLKNENDSLKSQIIAVKEELDTYKSPGTCTLRSALKYPVSRSSHTRNLVSSENNTDSEPLPPPKRRKTLPFARLLTNEE